MLEITWPTSRTTQVFRDIPADQIIEITEFGKDYLRLRRKARLRGYKTSRERRCLSGISLIDDASERWVNFPLAA